jgi:phosphoribosylaminoimidazolecarboxamide formyltransferase / IMP cyclohydrolase
VAIHKKIILSSGIHVNNLTTIKNALISVSDKSGLKELALFLKERSVSIFCSGNTAKFLAGEGISVHDVSSITQFPEILDGRVKTLNPRVHAGILFDRSNQEHIKLIENLAIPPIDLVVTNLYPFAKVCEEKNVEMAQLMEYIDIGGPAMLRAAAKNHLYVTVLHAPHQYVSFMDHYEKNQGVSLKFRELGAAKAFAESFAYDQKVASVLTAKFANSQSEEESILSLRHGRALRYGENPHQKAAIFFVNTNENNLCLPHLDSLQGKELSYNNFLDIHAAIRCLRIVGYQNIDKKAAVIIKHSIPCGAAFSDKQASAIVKALASDHESAFGGILALSHEFDEACLAPIADQFLEIIIAPQFSDDARAYLLKRKNLRLLAINQLMTASLDNYGYKSIFGGMLRQDLDPVETDDASWSAVTQRKPNKKEWSAMNFAFRIVKGTPSNAIALAYPDQLVGLGAGQPNRIKSAELAILGALKRGFDISNAALASDGFFPFGDCIKLAHAHGVQAIVQPGGSMRDQEIIKQADELGLSMVFAQTRHFLH